MTRSTHISAGIFLVRLRDDMPRAVSTAHWAGPHADLMRKVPHIAEYVQQQFSPTDHGYWPSSPRVGTDIPTDFRIDGFAEVRFDRLADMVRSSFHSGKVLCDEQNLFLHVVGQLTGPRGGRWWPAASEQPTQHTTAVFFRRRHFNRDRSVSRKAFHHFVHDEVGNALHAAGAQDLRTYTFVPSSKLANRSPGVSHEYPVERRVDGSVVFAANSPDGVHQILESPSVRALVDRQATFISAAHAYTIERSETVIDNLDRQGPSVAPARS